MSTETFKTLPALLLGLALAVFLLVGLFSRLRRGTSSSYYGVGVRSIGRIGIGAAIASNWMSAASFLGIAGIFYVKGYFAFAYVVGWTGGYVLLLILMASQIRRFGKYTAPEFVGARYDSPLARLLAAVIAILISLIYCVAQYKGIGLVFSWIFGLDYTRSLLLGTLVVISYLVISGNPRRRPQPALSVRGPDPLLPPPADADRQQTRLQLAPAANQLRQGAAGSGRHPRAD